MTIVEYVPELEKREITPPVPETIEDTGLPVSMIEQLILKILYYRGDTLGRDLAIGLGLKFSVIDSVVESLKRAHVIQVKRSLGMGSVSAVLALSEAGREHAREHLEACQYAGRAPVPLSQYTAVVKAQRLQDRWLTMDMLRDAFQHMVVSPQLLAQIGPAVNSGKSFLVYGQPGNGKTYLAEALFNVRTSDIYIPYAIEAQGMVIQMFDPIYHQAVEEDGSESAFAFESTYDNRWFRCKRPFIVSGGELTLEMLDLSYNPLAKFYDAPLQLKANNGIYLIDDFGRQKVSPAEVLNRWIVPMERRVDYLTFQNGTKMTVPFETFLIFSTNLKPEQLGDEAFLRRIQYKMLMKGPDEAEFAEIFTRFARAKGLKCAPDLVDWFLKKRYRDTGKARRRCHPRDVITHALDLINFEGRPQELNREVLDLAFESCFVSTGEVE